MRDATNKDQVNSQDLIKRMQFDDLVKVLCIRQLRWYDHVECSNCWLKKVQKRNLAGFGGRGLPKKTWTEMNHMD